MRRAVGLTRVRAVLAAAHTLILLVGPARAWDPCEAIALRDVPAIEAPESVIPKGDHDSAITQYRVNKSTKRAVFCSHGGYCYPTHLLIRGESVEALRLTNCKVGAKSDYQDEEELYYPVDIIREKFSSAQLRRYDVENQLLTIGLCSACAGSVAEQYISRPNARCGQLVRRAFEGNAKAKEALQNSPSVCEN